jgi:hypothetical protein
MIYDPITKQVVTLLKRYPEQKQAYRFGQKRRGFFRFVSVRYETEQPGGFPVGTVRDIDINNLVADDGSREIHIAYDVLRERRLTEKREVDE